MEMTMARKNHIELVHDAKYAINEVHNDQSVDRDVTVESLEELKEEIEMLLDALES